MKLSALSYQRSATNRWVGAPMPNACHSEPLASETYLEQNSALK